MNPVDRRTARHRRAPASHCFERGEGKLKTFISLAIVLLAIYSAVKIVPAYVSDYQLSDKMQEQARFAVVNRYTEDQIRANIFKVVQDLEIPAKPEAMLSLRSLWNIPSQWTCSFTTWICILLRAVKTRPCSEVSAPRPLVSGFLLATRHRRTPPSPDRGFA